MFFTADDGLTGRELWSSDGTVAGSVQLQDINPGPAGSAPYALTPLGDRLFFAADDGAGFELWASDGTAAGTRMAGDLSPAGSRAIIDQLTEAGGRLFFIADEGRMQINLWVIDSSAVHPLRLTDLGQQRDGPTQVRELTPVFDRLFFVADNPAMGAELWVSDGTPGGTRLVKDITLGPEGALPERLTVVGGALFFFVVSADGDEQLWVSDGTATGTQLVRSIAPRDTSGWPHYAVAANGRLFFSAQAHDLTHTLWRSDGTALGTLPLADVAFYPQEPFVGSDGMLLFVGQDDMHGAELWRSDGTPTGTRLVADLVPGPGSSVPGCFALHHRREAIVLFTSINPLEGIDLWQSDGTASGTLLLRTMPGQGVECDQPPFASAGAQTFVAADDGAHGVELWALPGAEVDFSVYLPIAQARTPPQ
jgi:ELWxxDGT repeat protein